MLGIVRGLKGAIELSSTPDAGTVFRVLLPVSGQPVALAAPTPSPSELWTTTGLALVVDDEDGVRRIGSRLLGILGFTVLSATTGEEAVRVFRETTEDIRVILLDLTMPGMDGVATLQELRSIDAGVRVVIASGYAESDVTSRFPHPPPAAFMQKPYRLEELRAQLRAILEPSNKLVP